MNDRPRMLRSARAVVAGFVLLLAGCAAHRALEFPIALAVARKLSQLQVDYILTFLRLHTAANAAARKP